MILWNRDHACKMAFAMAVARIVDCCDLHEHVLAGRTSLVSIPFAALDSRRISGHAAYRKQRKLPGVVGPVPSPGGFSNTL